MNGNGNGHKPFYKKKLWISLLAVFGALAIFFEVCRGCGVVVIKPAEATINKYVSGIADSSIKVVVRPIKRKLKAFELGQLEMRAYLKASLTQEQRDVGASYYKHDSIIMANSKEDEQ
jgi:hypothetical protein